jgi:hypothetical protein
MPLTSELGLLRLLLMRTLRRLFRSRATTTLYASLLLGVVLLVWGLARKRPLGSDLSPDRGAPCGLLLSRAKPS